jgi:DNA relaxase NicK
MEGHGVNVFASGCDAPFFAEQVRRRWPIHRVTRADVAIDFDSPGAWDWAFALLKGIAEEYKLKTRHEGDYHRAEDGRSFYLGGRQSVVRGVAYEKGKQIPELGMPDLTRIELRVFPKDRQSGELVAMLEPSALFGCSKWSAALGAYLDSETTMQRVVIGTRWNKSDRAKAIRAFVKQYGGYLGELCGELGGWDEVGLHLGELIREAATVKDRLIEDTKKVRRGESIKPEAVRLSDSVEEWA